MAMKSVYMVYRTKFQRLQEDGEQSGEDISLGKYAVIRDPQYYTRFIAKLWT